MNKHNVLLFGLGLLALAAVFRAWRPQPANAQQPVIQHPAFTAITVETVYGIAPGVPQIQLGMTQTFAVRRDGTNVRRILYPVTHHTTGEINLVDSKRETFDTIKMVSSFYGVPTRSFADEPKNCLQDEDSWANETISGPHGPIETIKGVKVTSSRTTTRWYAPSLACFEVKQIVVMNGISRSEQILAGLVMEDPDPKFFEVPSDYQEVAPSVKQRALNAYLTSLTGKSCATCDEPRPGEDDGYLRYGPASKKR